MQVGGIQFTVYSRCFFLKKKNSLLKLQTERLTSEFTTAFGARTGENNVEVKIMIEDGSLALKLQRNRNIPD